jgi:hypothetical protein
MNNNTWLGNSAASTHMDFAENCMTKVEFINSLVWIGNGKALTATKNGKHHIMIIEKDGSIQDVILKEYKCVPALWVNLFYIYKSLFVMVGTSATRELKSLSQKEKPR